jgi:hypothetical protein
MTTRKELVESLGCDIAARRTVTGPRFWTSSWPWPDYHRKHAIRLLRKPVAVGKVARARDRLYEEAVRETVTVLWEAADRVCGKRLKALIPMLVDAMERHGHLDLDPAVKTKVLQVSAATIDRVLADARSHIDGKAPAPHWRGRGHQTQHFGAYVHTLTLTDIASGWTECVAMRMRDQMLVIEAFEKVVADLPFAMLGI